MKTYLDNLRPFEKRVVVGVGVLLFIVLNVWFVFPHFSDWGNMKIRRREAQEKLQKYLGEINKKPFYEGQLKQLQSENQDVPAEDQSIQFARAIQNEQARSGVQITGTTKPTYRTNQFFVELSQNLTILSGEKELIDFLYSLGAGNSLIRVRDMSVRPDPPRFKLNANVKLVASYQKKAATPAPRGRATKTTAASPAPAWLAVSTPKPLTTTVNRP